MKFDINQLKPVATAWFKSQMAPKLRDYEAAIIGAGLEFGAFDDKFQTITGILAKVTDENGIVDLERMRQALNFGLSCANGVIHFKYVVNPMYTFTWDFDKADIDSFMDVAKEFAK